MQDLIHGGKGEIIISWGNEAAPQQNSITHIPLSEQDTEKQIGALCIKLSSRLPTSPSNTY